MAEFDPDSFLASTPAASFDPDAFLSNSPAPTVTGEVTKAAQRGLMEGADTLRALSNPVSALEKGTYQPIARLANYLKPDLNLPTHLLPNVSDLAAKVAPGYEQGIAPDPHAPAGPRYAGSVAETAANPFSWVGPGGPLLKAGMAVAAGLGAQAGEDVAGTPGRIVGGMLLPAGIGARGAMRPAEVAPTAPIAGSRRSLSAASDAGPLAGVSPATADKLKSLMIEQGFTPHTLDARLDEMSPHHFLGELTPSFEAEMGAVAAPPGPAKIEVVNSVQQRAREAPDRLRGAFDQAFGDNENRSQLNRAMAIERDQAARPFYDAFRNARVSPTPQLTQLMPALESSGALRWANKALTMERQPAQNGFTQLGAPGEGGPFISHNPDIMTGGPQAPVQQVPTAQAFQYAKEFLDKQIEASLAAPGGANEARIYTGLKNALVDAIDNHPDRNVAGLWKAARDTYASPTQVMSAMKFGERVLTENVHPDELPFLTAAFSPTEINAMKTGMRGYLEDRLGRPGRQERATINQILAPNNQAKVRWALGDKAAEALFTAIEHEEHMQGAPTRIIQGSPTAFRLEAQKRWTPQPGLLDNVSLGDVAGAVRHPFRTGVGAVAGQVGARRMTKREAEFAKVREEASRLFTLQGPERDAAARALLGVDASGTGAPPGSAMYRPPPGIPTAAAAAPGLPESPTVHARGGKVANRARGGRVNPANIDHNPTEAQKRSGNYAKDHVRIHGIDITIENAKGAKRSGTGRDGRPWSVRMPAHYGYVKRTEGADGDHVDVYLGPHLKAPNVFVVDQRDADSRAFDEHKVLLGFGSATQARHAYLKAFSDGRGHERLGHMAAMTIDEFKHWLARGDTAKPIRAHRPAA